MNPILFSPDPSVRLGKDKYCILIIKYYLVKCSVELLYVAGAGFTKELRLKVKTFVLCLCLVCGFIFGGFHKSNLIYCLQAQYLQHRGELSALIKQYNYQRESQGAFKVSNPGLWV